MKLNKMTATKKRIHGVKGSKYHSKKIKSGRRIKRESTERRARIAARKAS